MSTLLASYWGGTRPDCSGFPTFSSVPSVCRGGNAIRVLLRSHGLAVVTFAEVGAQGAAGALITDQCKDRAHESDRRRPADKQSRGGGSFCSA